MSVFDLAKEIDRLADAGAPDGTSCPRRPDHPCDVEDWVYETESTRPRLYGWCRYCDTSFIVVLPRRRGLTTDAETLERIHANDMRHNPQALETVVVDATERTLRRSGIAQALPDILDARPLALTRDILLAVYHLAFRHFADEYHPRERQLTNLLDEVYRRIERFEDEKRKLSKRAMQADILAMQEKLADLRRQTTSARQELAQVRSSLREVLAQIKTARDEARREPLPVPDDYIAPALEEHAVLCESLYPREVVYALVDPADPELVRYVGRTCDPVSRYRTHCTAGADQVRGWVDALVADGRRPAMVLLERCESEVVAEREAFWIHYYRDRFQADLNRSIPPRVEETADVA